MSVLIVVGISVLVYGGFELYTDYRRACNASADSLKKVYKVW